MPNWEDIREEIGTLIEGSDLLGQIDGLMPDDEIAMFSFVYVKHSGELACDDPAAKTIVVRKFTRHCPPGPFSSG